MLNELTYVKMTNDSTKCYAVIVVGIFDADYLWLVCLTLLIYFIHLPLYQTLRIWELAVNNEQNLFDHYGTLVVSQQPESKEHCWSVFGWKTTTAPTHPYFINLFFSQWYCFHLISLLNSIPHHHNKCIIDILYR